MEVSLAKRRKTRKQPIQFNDLPDDVWKRIAKQHRKMFGTLLNFFLVSRRSSVVLSEVLMSPCGIYNRYAFEDISYVLRVVIHWGPKIWSSDHLCTKWHDYISNPFDLVDIGHELIAKWNELCEKTNDISPYHEIAFLRMVSGHRIVSNDDIEYLERNPENPSEWIAKKKDATTKQLETIQNHFSLFDLPDHILQLIAKHHKRMFGTVLNLFLVSQKTSGLFRRILMKPRPYMDFILSDAVGVKLIRYSMKMIKYWGEYILADAKLLNMWHRWVGEIDHEYRWDILSQLSAQYLRDVRLVDIYLTLFNFNKNTHLPKLFSTSPIRKIMKLSIRTSNRPVLEMIAAKGHYDLSFDEYDEIFLWASNFYCSSHKTLDLVVRHGWYNKSLQRDYILHALFERHSAFDMSKPILVLLRSHEIKFSRWLLESCLKLSYNGNDIRDALKRRLLETGQ